MKREHVISFIYSIVFLKSSWALLLFFFSPLIFVVMAEKFRIEPKMFRMMNY